MRALPPNRSGAGARSGRALLALAFWAGACGRGASAPDSTPDAGGKDGGAAGNDAAAGDGDASAPGDCPELRVLDEFVVIREPAELAELRCVSEARSGIVIGGAEIRSLAELRYLERADGLTISDNPQLADLSGLERLREVGSRGLTIARNPELRDVNALESLERVRGKLDISDNARLESLTGLHGLVSVASLDDQTRDGYVLIVKNPQLTSLAALGGLTEIQAGLHVCGNERLSELIPDPSALASENLRLNVLFNRALTPERVLAFSQAIKPLHQKLAANGPAPYELPASCPYQGDGLCDESTYIHGDVIELCEEWPCCALEGPTMLCTDGSDDPDDCPQQGGLPL